MTCGRPGRIEPLHDSGASFREFIDQRTPIDGLHRGQFPVLSKQTLTLFLMDVGVIDAGMVDNTSKAHVAADLFKREDVEIIFLFISTYALSSTVLPVVQKAEFPVVLLNIQPVAQLDYDKFNALDDRGKMTGVWLERCQSCSLPELAYVFNRADIAYHIVSGYLQEDYVWKEIGNWVDAANVAAGMRANRVGILGHYYGGMLDVYRI